MAGGTVLPALDGASTCRRVWMTRGRRPGVGTAACGWSQCEVALSQAARGSRRLLPCSLPREALPGHRRGHLLARQRVPPQPHSPEELSPSASCQDLAAGLPACPARHRGPGHSESGLTAQDVGWPLGGPEHSIRACRVTGQGHRVLGLLRHPVVPPWCHPRPPSAGQEQPYWLGCRLPGSSGRGAACPCPATGVAAVAATRTTPPAKGPGLSGPGGHGRVTAGQTEGVGCCLVRPNGQLFAGVCGRDQNCPSAGPAGGREERAVGVSSGRVWARSRFCLLKE